MRHNGSRVGAVGERRITVVAAAVAVASVVGILDCLDDSSPGITSLGGTRTTLVLVQQRGRILFRNPFENGASMLQFLRGWIPRTEPLLCMAGVHLLPKNKETFDTTQIGFNRLLFLWLCSATVASMNQISFATNLSLSLSLSLLSNNRRYLACERCQRRDRRCDAQRTEMM